MPFLVMYLGKLLDKQIIFFLNNFAGKSSESSSNALDISEIAVEDDSSALDDFLKSDDFTAKSQGT